jgi:hypothetical protein
MGVAAAHRVLLGPVRDRPVLAREVGSDKVCP